MYRLILVLFGLSLAMPALSYADNGQHRGQRQHYTQGHRKHRRHVKKQHRRKSLPPGQRKQLERRGHLPPGQAKKM